MISSSKNVLITGARAPVALDLSRRFAEAGHRVLVAETVPFHVCRFSRYVQKSFTVPRPVEDPLGFIDALVEIVSREQVDLVLPVCEEVFYVAQGLHRFPSRCHVFCDSLDKLVQLHDKWTFGRLLQKMGVDAPQTWLLRDPEQLSAVPKSLKIILKPVYSRFALHVHVLEPGDRTLPPSISITQDSPWLAQEYIEGRRWCTSSVAHRGQITAHVAYPVTFCVRAMGSCVYYEHVEHPKLQKWVEAIVADTQFTGQISFDLIEDASGRLMAIECNPRPTSGVHLFTQRDHLPEAFFGEPRQPVAPDPKVHRQLTVGMIFFGWRSAWQQRKLGRWLWEILTARDALFQWDDPLPYFSQPWILFRYWLMSRRLHKGLVEAATFDMEWNGDGEGLDRP